jgi:hypothetical protein
LEHFLKILMDLYHLVILHKKKVNGRTCLDKAYSEGHVVISGHTLTIEGINVDKINKVSTERSIVGFDTGKGVFNCVDKIFDSKP